jgi:hypothetical protein
MSKVTSAEKAIQDRSRKARFASNGEPARAPGFDKDTLEPGDALVNDRNDLLHPKGAKSALSGPFNSLDEAVSSIKSADSGTRS